ncbi:MAG: hypothetical protein JO267_10685 [Alphaproteobacteria bacterium]|nr:hypothetical protein [Alphaproteobacteria bacterium]
MDRSTKPRTAARRSGRGNTASAWLVATGFAAFAGLSFAVDQGVALSPAAAADAPVEFEPLRVPDRLAALDPMPIIATVVDALDRPEAGGAAEDESRD